MDLMHVGHHDKSDLPHCWYTWVVFSLIPIMFIAGMIVQFCKTGKDSDHRQGNDKKKQTKSKESADLLWFFTVKLLGPFRLLSSPGQGTRCP